MKTKNIIIVSAVVLLLGGSYYYFRVLPGMVFNDIAQSHIEGNVPEENNFDQYLKRDLTNYFSNKYAKEVSVEYAFLREGATQSGVAYPKYYLWVKIYNGTREIDQGAIRVAAINKTQFSVTDFMTKKEIVSDPNRIYSVFPAPVCEKIKTEYL